MGNLLNSLKSFLANKNTVTILGVLAGVVVLYIGYNYRVNKNIQTITVYYVKEAVPSNTQLTDDMISKVDVNYTITKTYKNLVTNLSQIKDSSGAFYYVNFDHSLTEGSLLCTDDLIAKADKADEKLYKNLKKGEKIFKIDVSLDTTHGNSLAPGNAIDIWVQGKDDQQKVIFTPFIENLKVIDVVDNKWSTTAGNEESSPKYLITAVPSEMFVLLSKVTLLPTYQFKIIPVARDEEYVEGTEAKLINDSIKNLIESNSVYQYTVE